jgi:hypothetical protein
MAEPGRATLDRTIALAPVELAAVVALAERLASPAVPAEPEAQAARA